MLPLSVKKMNNVEGRNPMGKYSARPKCDHGGRKDFSSKNVQLFKASDEKKSNQRTHVL